MASHEQADTPLDPLAVCEAKFSEAYRFAIEGDENVRIIKGIEATPFFYGEPEGDYYYGLQRSVPDNKLAADVAYWITEVVDKRNSTQMILRDYIVKSLGKVIELGTLSEPLEKDDRPFIFDVGVVDLNILPPNIEEVLLTHELDDEESTELLSRLQRAIPIVK
jgi:hypothetical protein